MRAARITARNRNLIGCPFPGGLNRFVFGILYIRKTLKGGVRFHENAWAGAGGKGPSPLKDLNDKKDIKDIFGDRANDFGGCCLGTTFVPLWSFEFFIKSLLFSGNLYHRELRITPPTGGKTDSRLIVIPLPLYSV